MTDCLLQVSEFMMVVSVFTITLMTFALAGLALGFGTLFPQFETENAAQIPTSFGGLLFMMSVGRVIGGGDRARGAAGVRLSRGAGVRGGDESADVEMVVGFGLAAALCLTATFLPIASRCGGWRRRAVEDACQPDASRIAWIWSNVIRSQTGRDDLHVETADSRVCVRPTSE